MIIDYPDDIPGFIDSKIKDGVVDFSSSFEKELIFSDSPEYLYYFKYLLNPDIEIFDKDYNYITVFENGKQSIYGVSVLPFKVVNIEEIELLLNGSFKDVCLWIIEQLKRCTSYNFKFIQSISLYADGKFDRMMIDGKSYIGRTDYHQLKCNLKGAFTIE